MATRDEGLKIGFCYDNVYQLKPNSKVNFKAFHPGKPTTFNELKNDLAKAGKLNKDLKEMIDALERLVK